MNNIQEKDWAEEDWGGHTGMDTSMKFDESESPKKNKEDGQDSGSDQE
ncbi:MAG: hypothetical protein ACLFVQ_00450 [Chitinispirillaceae bacterium]